MLSTQLITANLPGMSPGQDLGSVTQVNIYLYRATEPRFDLHPLDCWMDDEDRPSRDFDTFVHFGPDNIAFVFWIHRGSLASFLPLYFHIVAFAWKVYPCVFTTFFKMGGGGRGTQGDAPTLRELLDSLRAFPKGWMWYIDKVVNGHKEPVWQGVW